MWSIVTSSAELKTLRPRQDGGYFAVDVLKCIFLNENVWISLKIPLKFVPSGPFNNIRALVQMMAWRRPGDKPLSEPMLVFVPTHICVTRPQWVKQSEWYSNQYARIVFLSSFMGISRGVRNKITYVLSWRTVYALTQVIFCCFVNNTLERMNSSPFHAIQYAIIYSDVIMSAMAPQVTSILTVCSTAHQTKHQSSASLAFMRGIYRWVTSGFPSQMASNGENVSTWWILGTLIILPEKHSLMA